MTCCRVCTLALATFLLSHSALAQSPAAYRVPPAPIPAILDAPPVPSALLSPTGDRLVLLQPRAMPTIAEMAEPVRRLAWCAICRRVGCASWWPQLRDRVGRRTRWPAATSRRHPVGRR